MSPSRTHHCSNLVIEETSISTGVVRVNGVVTGPRAAGQVRISGKILRGQIVDVYAISDTSTQQRRCATLLHRYS